MYEILNNRGIVQLRGEDACKFLQNLTTNDIEANEYSYNYLLSSQGRYLSDFFVFKQDKNSFLIDIPEEQTEFLISRLRLYKLRAKVEIIDQTNNYRGVYSRNWPDFAPESVITHKDPRFDQLGYRSIVLLPTAKAINSQKGLYTEDKYSFGIPDGYIDLSYDKSIPVEYGAEELHAISYSKGCYIGQEVISRAKYQGVVRKKLFKISAPVVLDTIEQGAELVASEKKIGIISSVYKNLAIALVREEEYLNLEKKTAFLSGLEVELSVPPWRQ